jgi:hypothetical protein
MSATTTQLLSSGEFCKLRYDTIPVKSASGNVSFYTNNSKKRQILSRDTIVANERYVLPSELRPSAYRLVHTVSLPTALRQKIQNTAQLAMQQKASRELLLR